MFYFHFNHVFHLSYYLLLNVIFPYFSFLCKFIFLFSGNVTLRVDPIWGLSGTLPVSRTHVPIYTQSIYDYDKNRLNDPIRMTQMTDYDRCKINRRCNWGESCTYLQHLINFNFCFFLFL